MININKVLLDNKYLIERFIDLIMCRDQIYDSRHYWFYSLVSKDVLDKLLSYTSEDDIRQEIYLYIITSAQKYKYPEKFFNNWLKKAIGWKLRDYCVELAIFHRNLRLDLSQSQTEDQQLTLEWVFLTEDNIPLTWYEKYILYLYLSKCYTITRITKLTYQDRKTIRNSLKHAITVLKEYYATN